MNVTEKLVRERCTGCGLCSVKCPQKCIDMKENEEGFLYPSLNNSRCIDCQICIKQCPIINNGDMLMDSNAAKYYAAIIKNKVLLSKSSSGGVFGALAEYVLSLGGAVCGCVYNEQMEVVHIISESQNDVKKMYGSKYVQSRIGDCYEQIKKRLLTGQVVLFTGTACQVAAVRSYLGHNYDNFFTVDVLCHGVPSPGLFRMFVEHLSKKNHNRVIDIRFRDKSKNGWGSEHRTSVSYENGKKRWLFMPAYFSAFFYGMSLRESCYVCSFAGKDRVSDITIGDYWGSWKKYKKRFSEGISVISVNTDKGLNLFNLIKDDFSFCDELTQHEAFWSNNNFVNPVKKPKEREKFYLGLSKYSSTILRTYLTSTYRKKVLISFYGAIIPEKIRIALHK